jgi:heme-degrading monooxygenase HmoA
VAWTPRAGSDDGFVEAWTEFAGASGMPGAGRLQLVHALHEQGRFVSFGDWESIEQVRAWKSSPDFREQIAQVLQHVEEFKPLALLATTQAGAAKRGGSAVTP